MDRSLLGLATMFTNIERALVHAPAPDDALAALTHTAVQTVPAAQAAGVTASRVRTRFATIGATDDLVVVTDNIQYDLRSGPCVDAVLQDRIFRTGDLANDERWPIFGGR